VIRWHRGTVREPGALILVYYTLDEDWQSWSIDRRPVSNGSRSSWYEYQPKYFGEDIGLRHTRLRDAKAFVERHGRPLDEGERS
jgi:hypothetical protein